MSKPATEDLVLTPPPPAVKPSRHVVIALAHMGKRRDALIAKREVIDKELAELDTAMGALHK